MEDEYRSTFRNYPTIIGSDEAGYGSWAGPVVACAVAVPSDWRVPQGLDDSKKLNAKKREDLFERMQYKVPYHCEMADADEIDRDGIITALHRCFRVSIEKLLEKHPDALVVIDGEVKLKGIKHLNFPRADGIVPAVMAASVIGKVLHDKKMRELGNLYPGYELGVHQGYGTPAHKLALEKKGPCPCHRKSYTPIKKAMGEDPGIGIVIEDGSIDLSELSSDLS